MSNQDKTDCYIRNIPKNPHDKYIAYQAAKQFYNLQIGWTDQYTYNSFIRIVSARIGL